MRRPSTSFNAPMFEPTDRGVIDDLSKKTIFVGEDRLLFAILENAIDDFQKYALAKNRKGKRLFLAVEDWLLDTGADSFFCFESICEHLHLDPSYIRGGLMRWKEAKLASHAAEQLAANKQTSVAC